MSITKPIPEPFHHERIPFAPTVSLSEPSPIIEGGKYPIKRVVGEPLVVEMDIFKDGHDVIQAILKWRKVGAPTWHESPMTPTNNDRWSGQVTFDEVGLWEYTVEAWPDAFRSWKKSFKAKLDANSDDLELEKEEGAILIEGFAKTIKNNDTHAINELKTCAETVRELHAKLVSELLLSDELQFLLDRTPDRTLATSYNPNLKVRVERERARFSTWYEFFPRSAEGRDDKHSTFRDCLARLDDAAAMGFDVIYFPPIHPIGRTNRKGKNNSLTAGPDDVGSPWAIGSEEGGFRNVHPELGTVEDFEWLLGEAHKRGLEIALDFAIQCSPDHPYVKDHPEWFNKRADGSIRYAENPPKKYQDIYPINFHCPDWRKLWRELADAVFFWVRRGVKIFRVDNPHTKPFAFWEYLIAEVQKLDPDVLFLAEAFTRPKMMRMLGKIGFTQSYTYFTWRVGKQELMEYVMELTAGDMQWFYRGNFWPNTPDILAVPLQHGNAAIFKIRAALAALLMPSWGMYSGYEFCENIPHPGKEEYTDNEKYQLKARDWNAPGNLKGFIGRLNHIRKENPALQLYDNVTFVPVDNPNIIAWIKRTPDGGNRMLVVVTLDSHHRQESTLHLPLDVLGLGWDATYHVHDLMHGDYYTWHGSTNFVALEPSNKVCHVFRIEA